MGAITSGSVICCRTLKAVRAAVYSQSGAQANTLPEKWYNKLYLPAEVEKMENSILALETSAEKGAYLEHLVRVKEEKDQVRAFIWVIFFSLSNLPFSTPNCVKSGP
jgi:hypothetical protein